MPSPTREEVLEAVLWIKGRLRELRLTLDVVPENGPQAQKIKAEIAMWDGHLSFLAQACGDAGKHQAMQLNMVAPGDFEAAGPILVAMELYREIAEKLKE